MPENKVVAQIFTIACTRCGKVHERKVNVVSAKLYDQRRAEVETLTAWFKDAAGDEFVLLSTPTFNQIGEDNERMRHALQDIAATNDQGLIEWLATEGSR